jgi:hypothetical protein
MASTYSNLKIQLMTTGENSGTWGNVTNVNLGTALEEAIVGSADVTFSSTTVTLSLTDSNATQTARNLRLNLTGTSGGAQNLIVPAIEKVYIVNNGCADAITVKNSSGTGIAVPAGKTMWVYNDGTNVVDAVTYLTSLTLGTALPIASGGTGSNSATFSGANISALNGTSITTGTVANARTPAASANGASTIVARDASGNFTANVITADGSALTALNGTAISTGTVANARTTAASANGASTIVARDASGNFTAAVITATTVSATTVNATTVNATGSIIDVAGNVRAIPPNAKTTGYTLVIGDLGKYINTNSAVTIPNAVFSSGDVVSIFNSTASTLSVVQGASTTLRKGGSATTGNLTVSAYGVATVLCTSANNFVLVGNVS